MNFKKPKFWDLPVLSIWSILLYPLSLLFLFASSILRILKVEKKIPIPIICIGNIYVGGTGKTPLAKEVFQITKSLGKNPAFIKKYYSYLEDEIDMLQKTGKTFFLNKRKDSIETLIKKALIWRFLTMDFRIYQFTKILILFVLIKNNGQEIIF